MVRKVASPEGVKRYGLPKGTPLDGSRGRTARKVLTRLSSKVEAPSSKKSAMPKLGTKTTGPKPPKPKPQPTPRTAKKQLDRILGRDKNGKPQEMVRADDYGMKYDSKGAREVERARAIPKEIWDELPTETIKHGTPIIANEKHLKKRSIDKVVGGKEPFREGYVGQMWRDKDGNLHMADGHTRKAMYHALGKDMPAKVMDESSLKKAQDRMVESVVSKADAEKAAMNIHDNEPEPSSAARAVAKRVQGKAKAAERQITHDVVTAAAHNGGTMERLGFRLKEEKSFALKIDRNMHAKKNPDTGEFTTTPEQEADLIRDAVRYTATVPTSTYWKGGDKILAELKNKGHEVVKDKGGDGRWPKRKYRGRNVQLKSPEGVYWELQIHTAESLAVAEKNHVYYNEWRHQDTPITRVQELDVIMGDLFESIPVPPDTTLVEDRPDGAG